RLVDQVFEVGAGEADRLRRDGVQVDVRRQRLAIGVHGQDRLAAPQVGAIQHHTPVEATGTQQGGVENVRAVGGGDDNDDRLVVKAVHLDQDLVERLFALVVRAAQAGPAVATDRVDFVDEYNAGC